MFVGGESGDGGDQASISTELMPIKLFDYSSSHPNFKVKKIKMGSFTVGLDYVL